MFKAILRVAVPMAVAIGLTAAGGMSQAARTPGWRVIGLLPGEANITSDFNVVAADGPADAWIAGSVNDALTVRHWTGKSWQSVAVPNSRAFSQVIAVAAVSPSSVWIFASVGTSTAQKTAVLRWTGKRWRAPTILNAFVAATVAFKGDNVWVFGLTANSEAPYAARYNGSKWLRVAAPPLYADVASATSPGNIWVMGQPVKHSSPLDPVQIDWFNGHKWITTQHPPFNLPSGWFVEAPEAIVADGPSNVYATGSIDEPDTLLTGLPEQSPYVWHWDGAKWFNVRVPYSNPFKPNIGTMFAPVDGAIAQDGHGGVWLAEQNQDSNALVTGAYGVLLHYGNHVWSRFSVPATKADVDLPGALAWIPGTRSVWGIGAEQPGDSGGNFDTTILKYGV
jgi:hypothetical protein